MTLLFHQLAYEQRIFWRSREAAIFIFIFPLLLYTLLGSVYSDEIEVDGVSVASADILLGGPLRLRSREHRVRRSRDHPRRQARDRNSETASFDAPPTSDLHRRRPPLDPRDLRAAGGFARPPGEVRLRRERPRELAWLRRRRRSRRRLLCRSRGGCRLAHSLGRRGLRGRQCGPPPDGVPLRLVRTDARTIPAFLDAIADVLPLTYFLDIVNGVYLDGESLFADPTALAIVAAWGAAGLVIALTRFSWMPHER